VIYVNIGLDKDFYSEINNIKDTNNTLILVNKYNKLPDKFEADNLITFSDSYSYNSQKMNKIAAENMMKLIDDARSNGYTLMVVSGYRTERLQNTLYTNSVNQNGKAHADAFSARPGHSEHQTGLAVDISNIAGTLDGFEKYPVYEWIIKNAHKYGFIERYPKGKEFITGYGYEPWHYRYVGVDVATTIYEENITFEEYSVKYLKY
jgi:D-alanyl-D-alanine carboxypeptidase